MKTKKTYLSQYLYKYRIYIQFFSSIPIIFSIIQDNLWISNLLIICSFLLGAFYCGYFCPFGLLQEFASKLSLKLKLPRYQISRKLDLCLKSIRYILFSCTSVIIVMAVFRLITFDPRSNLGLLLKGRGISIIPILSIIFFFILSMFINKPFCKYFCIMGAKHGLASLFRIVTIRRDIEGCIHCKRCDKACNLDITVSTCKYSLNSPNCINCMACIQACPKPGILRYGFVPKKELVLKTIGALCLSLIIFVSNHLTGEGLVNASDEVIPESMDEKYANESNISVKTILTGSGDGFKGPVFVEVKLVGEVMDSISIVSHSDDDMWFEMAKDEIIPLIINSQSPDVEVVSGATFSSNGIINGVKDALSKK